MMKFRSKLLLAIVSLVALAIMLMGFTLMQLFDSYTYGKVEENMERQAESVISYLENEEEQEASLKEASSGLHSVYMSIAVYSEERELLYANDPPSHLSKERHLQYAKTIIGGEQPSKEKIPGGFDVLYYAAPVFGADEELDGYIVLADQVENLFQLTDNNWLLLIVGILIILVVICLIADKIAAGFTKPIDTATNTAIELAKGNYKARTYVSPSGETKLLSTSINILARNLQEMETSKEMEADRLSTLIENIGSGVLLIDGKGYITLVNKAYKQLFHVSESAFLHRLYYEAIPFEEVNLFIEDIFMKEKSVKKQMLLSMTIERKTFEVYGAPVIGHNDEWRGIVLVFHDITELKKLELMRQDFVANVSHELRTPITSIKGFSETLLDSDLQDKKILRNFLTIILNESDRLQTLIQELLELSKIEKQEFKLQLEQVDLNALLLETQQMFRKKAANKNIDLQAELPDVIVLMEGDAYRLKQIFINLIHNAINYTLAGGEVKLKLTEEGEWVQVEIVDTGIGIAKEEIPRIFERFYRVNRDRSRNSGGTGLGLAIVKHLVEAHHGELEVDSVLQKGTSFKVKLKKKQDQHI